MTRYLIDFDSTLVRAETLDVLAEITLADAPDRAARAEAVRALTERAMAGALPFSQALRERVSLLDARREHLPALVAALTEAIAPSARRCAAFLARPDVFVVSGGFEEVIAPVVLALGVSSEQIRGNRFTYDAAGRVVGVDGASPLAQDGGKIAVARALGGEDVVVVGDGWTDLEVWTAGAARRFYAFTEVVARPEVLARAALRAESFEDLLRQEGLAL